MFQLLFPTAIFQAAKSRILLDRKGEKWLKTGDAGHVDDAGRVWLVGRTSWKVEKDGTTFWSVLVEEKVCLVRCSYRGDTRE